MKLGYAKQRDEQNQYVRGRINQGAGNNKGANIGTVTGNPWLPRLVNGCAMKGDGQHPSQVIERVDPDGRPNAPVHGSGAHGHKNPSKLEQDGQFGDVNQRAIVQLSCIRCLRWWSVSDPQLERMGIFWHSCIYLPWPSLKTSPGKRPIDGRLQRIYIRLND